LSFLLGQLDCSAVASETVLPGVTLPDPGLPAVLQPVLIVAGGDDTAQGLDAPSTLPVSGFKPCLHITQLFCTCKTHFIFGQKCTYFNALYFMNALYIYSRVNFI